MFTGSRRKILDPSPSIGKRKSQERPLKAGGGRPSAEKEGEGKSLGGV